MALAARVYNREPCIVAMATAPMELSPPLSDRSPDSPTNDYYCSPEDAFLYYYSPNYKVPSTCVTEPVCSMDASHDWTGSHLTATSRSSSVFSTSSIPIHSPVSTSLPDPSCLDYDVFTRYGSPLHASYSHDLYPPPHARRPPSLMPSLHPHDASHSSSGVVHSQPLEPSSRPVSSFSRSSHASGILTPRSQGEDDASYGSSSLGVPHSASLRPSPPYLDPPVMPYFEDSASSSWPRPDSDLAPPHLYPAAPLDQDPGTAQDAAAFAPRAPQHQKSARPKRSQRRLTTREAANFQCAVPGCGKLFSRSYNYRAHMETHDENREYPFPCQVDGCGKKFVRKTDLVRHHSSIHAKERNHVCDYCGRSFARKDTLRRHMDDGCARRFDLGTLDIRASETYDSRATAQRGLEVEMTSQSMPPMQLPSTLPRAVGHPEANMMRARGLWTNEASSYQHHDQGQDIFQARVQGQNYDLGYARGPA
ncbi:hypothetical protein ACRALDRAFT_1082073 [Sodiomyces alcalophilus JCM 7366]|uniref:uncharacterized protein n=1 Tax=Sodiomyces alcalophilus JCM 7366 TaxID=591952 RepID=UPI0039B5F411